MISLATCVATIYVGFSQPATEFSEDLQRDIKQIAAGCAVHFPDAPCLRKLERTADGNYNVTCGYTLEEELKK